MPPAGDAQPSQAQAEALALEATDPADTAPENEAPADDNDTAATAAAEPAPEVAEPTPPKPRDPNLAARAACVKKGGRFSRTKTGAFVCVTRTRDANKACTASTQCEGSCLARSGTCSPVTPLIGCHDILTGRGSMATVCID